MPLLTSILLIIVVSRFLGELMVRVKQPRIVGELLCGILVGPAILNLVQPSAALSGIAELSVFLIVLSAGLEMEFGEVLKALRAKNPVILILDFLIPVGLAALVGYFFELKIMQIAFLGLCISITALPVAIRFLSEFKILNSRIASYAVATAIINDVFALLCLGVILDMPREATRVASDFVMSVAKTVGKLCLLGGAIYLASWAIKWGTQKTRYIERGLNFLTDLVGKEVLFGLAILFVLFFGSLSEQMGSHFVIGAFFGALLLSSDVFGYVEFRDIEKTINSISAGFLAPVFLAYLGLNVSRDVVSHPPFLAAVLLVSVLAKILVGYVGGRWSHFSRVEALGVGIILNGRGVMELVVANIAYQNKLISQELFSVLVIMGLFTTVLTPILFRNLVLKKL